jgi:hypothetical protein
MSGLLYRKADSTVLALNGLNVDFGLLDFLLQCCDHELVTHSIIFRKRSRALYKFIALGLRQPHFKTGIYVGFTMDKKFLLLRIVEFDFHQKHRLDEKNVKAYNSLS